ncbi:hypothetical protein B0T14DRAFT_599322 [Immersiella caudata]|uniref:Uncharacterized protein n=1 Tax=Immersiella caudata TaxID=314043 RepID=A0AA39X1Y0_9PEZI|nr:hypothetical protein B0T14DRAFT_599322 [Immersiella caudata]
MLEAKEKSQQDVAYLKSSMDDAICERDVSLLRALREEREAADAKVRATVLETQRMNMTLDQLVSFDGHRKAQRLLPLNSKSPARKPGFPLQDSGAPFQPLATGQPDSFAPMPTQKPDFTHPPPASALGYIPASYDTFQGASESAASYPPAPWTNSNPVLPPFHGMGTTTLPRFEEHLCTV